MKTKTGTSEKVLGFEYFVDPRQEIGKILNNFRTLLKISFSVVLYLAVINIFAHGIKLKPLHSLNNCAYTV